ncbi:hypothetical protein [Methylocystis sp. SC2]|uniref:hypothetical protein n=1 Tax=Methylocystis sp. (strain SC2) TaxID=187303 RepID=UPI00027AE840|nr:hypothetical protein [Methylocystis sp. SC2]CCJ06693.1 Hypothetical protein BN69_1242 [Methylocystis sp. SC2]
MVLRELRAASFAATASAAAPLNSLRTVDNAILAAEVTRAYNAIAADFFLMRNSKIAFSRGGQS